MAKNPENIDPIAANFEAVVDAVAPRADNGRLKAPAPLPAFDITDEVPIAIVKDKMNIADVEIDCVVLADETRLISDRGVSRAIETKRGGSHWLRKKEDGALNLPPYLSANNLIHFIPNDFIYILIHPVKYRATSSGAIGNGLLATAFPKVLRVWQAAYDV